MSPWLSAFLITSRAFDGSAGWKCCGAAVSCAVLEECTSVPRSALSSERHRAQHDSAHSYVCFTGTVISEIWKLRMFIWVWRVLIHRVGRNSICVVSESNPWLTHTSSPGRSLSHSFSHTLSHSRDRWLLRSRLMFC